MNNTLQTEIILQEKLPRKYQIMLFILSISLLTFLFTLPLKLKTYLDINFSVKLIDNKYYLTTYIEENNVKYILNNNKFKFNNKEYNYKLISISEENYVDNQNKIVKLICIESQIDSKYLIDNYAIYAKIKKEDKKVFEYIKSHFWKGNYMLELTQEEMLKVDGGFKISMGVIAGIGAAIVFVIGLIDGYINPNKCSN